MGRSRLRRDPRHAWLFRPPRLAGRRAGRFCSCPRPWRRMRDPLPRRRSRPPPARRRHGPADRRRRGGAPALVLEVAVDNKAAAALYAAHGFVAIGRRADYYRRGRRLVDALVLRLPLLSSPNST